MSKKIYGATLMVNETAAGENAHYAVIHSFMYVVGRTPLIWTRRQLASSSEFIRYFKMISAPVGTRQLGNICEMLTIPFYLVIRILPLYQPVAKEIKTFSHPYGAYLSTGHH